MSVPGLDAINAANSKLDHIIYMLNPLNWIKDLYLNIHSLVRSGTWDIPFLVATIILIWLWMFGAEWPKRYLFWGWIGFFLLRGFI